jgi:TrmH family RNA methyltransferase
MPPDVWRLDWGKPLHITSSQNPQIKAAVRLRESARERRAQGKFFLEGYRLCADAMASGYEPEILYLTEAAQLKYNFTHVGVVTISSEVAGKLGETATPQGVFGVFAIRNPQFTICSCLALEQVQDPGNLGAIARTAQALGMGGLVVSGGCDIYHPKALRASMGSLLRLPVLEVDDLCVWLRSCGLPSFAAVSDASALPVTQCDFSSAGVIVIGNEGNGLSPKTIAACGRRITIPMPGRAESLNAAAAATILIWEMARQLSDMRR